MNFKLGSSCNIQGDVQVRFVFDGGENDCLNDLSSSMQKQFIEKHALHWLYGKQGEAHQLIFGLGELDRITLEQIRGAAGAIGRAVDSVRAVTVQVELKDICTGLLTEPISEKELVLAWVEGWLLGTYTFNEYRLTVATSAVEQVLLGITDNEDNRTAIAIGTKRSEGVILARDLCNEPPNVLHPQSLRERVEAHFAGTKVEVRSYQGEELIARQMNGLIAVGKGSPNKPVMLELTHCTDDSKPLIVLVGKGITFDTGGMNVKSGRDLSGARFDLGGAAAVIGALHILSDCGLPLNVVGLIASAENVVDGSGMLPGEIIRYPNGLTVQVKNTDAEGRLVLADALLHAQQLGAATIIDIATLTGAIGTALGLGMAGIWGQEELIAGMIQAVHGNGDKLWHMPLVDEYESLLESPYADLSNLGTIEYGASIVAALFLRRFVKDNVNWAHIDMANVSEATKTSGYYVEGATGYGARLLADLVAQELDTIAHKRET